MANQATPKNEKQPYKSGKNSPSSSTENEQQSSKQGAKAAAQLPKTGKSDVGGGKSGGQLH